MAISRDLKKRAKQTREDGVFTLQLDDVPRREYRRHRRLAG
jgi:hypothetical protein